MAKETPSKLVAEGKRATKMLRGKTVAVVRRHRVGELMIEFTDKSRIFVDHIPDGLEISITGTDDAD